MHHVGGAVDPPLVKGAIWGHLPAHYELRGISGVSRSYSVGGSSGAADRCRCCSRLLLLLLLGKYSLVHSLRWVNAFVRVIPLSHADCYCCAYAFK